MLVTFRFLPFKALTAESLPEPGPFTKTSTFFTPYSKAASTALSAAICAAKGVLFLEPLKPLPPDVAQDNALQIGRASCRKECRSRWSPYH